jgi:two-component system OmpR family response regulator
VIDRRSAERAPGASTDRPTADRCARVLIDAERPGPDNPGKVRVLIVEDNAKMAALIKRVLVTEGYDAQVAADGASAVQVATAGSFGAIILDRMLPDMDGTSVVQRVREQGVTTPVLMLTALGSIADRVDGLDAGADDYLVKPFAFGELLARLRALNRRPGDDPDDSITIGDVTIDRRNGMVVVGERTIELSARESALLAFLMRHPNQTLTRAQIMDGVWGAASGVLANAVDLHVHNVRRKLAQVGRRHLLDTVRGEGYVIRDPGPT